MVTSNDRNLDPLSQEPGAHPVGTGLGAVAGGALTGATGGMMAGPAGAVVGAVVGAVAGGLGGKAAAEAFNPTAEEAYWRGRYNQESYYESGRSFDDYAPAYRLGMYARTQHQGRFEDAETTLSRDWESRRESSTLDWPQARHASRAAWERVGQSSGTAMGASSSSSEAMSRDDVADELNELLETCRDGEYGFNECAEHCDDPSIKAVFTRRAADCRTAATELIGLIRQYGDSPDEGGTVTGALHRGWVSVRGVLSGHSTQSMLDECERGEDAALARYRKALKQNLPPQVRTVVERQSEGVKRNHDQIKALRDANEAKR